MCQPQDGTLKKLQQLVRDELRRRGSQEETEPAVVACAILEKMGAGAVLREFPLIWGGMHYQLQQLTRAELRRTSVRGFGPREEHDDDGDGDDIVEPALPGFEELTKRYKRLHPQYPRAHKIGKYVYVQLMSYEDWVWNVRDLRAKLRGLAEHIEDLLRWGFEVHGWTDPDEISEPDAERC